MGTGAGSGSGDGGVPGGGGFRPISLCDSVKVAVAT
jgi:hypothetical protein